MDNKKNFKFFNTHSFFYTLKESQDYKGIKIEFQNKDGKIESVIIEDLEVSSKPISCKVYDKEKTKHIIPFVRVEKVYKGNELIWDNTNNKKQDVKVIKGYKK